ASGKLIILKVSQSFHPFQICCDKPCIVFNLGPRLRADASLNATRTHTHTHTRCLSECPGAGTPEGSIVLEHAPPSQSTAMTSSAPLPRYRPLPGGSGV